MGADRLAEAAAEFVHKRMRMETWGFAADEEMAVKDLLKIKYQGVRPAPGYPSQPDHSEKATMWKLLEVEKNIGAKLTSSYAMMPASAVSALVFAHPESQYFAVGLIEDDQVADYEQRKGASTDDA